MYIYHEIFQAFEDINNNKYPLTFNPVQRIKFYLSIPMQSAYVTFEDGIPFPTGINTILH